MNDSCCFYCKFYKHLDPDTDYCERQDVEVYFDTPPCGLFQYYKEDSSTDDSSVSDPAGSDSSTDESALVQYMPLEKLPKSDFGSFSIHRDPVTDVLYLASKTGYSGGLTVMLDPVSGLPLTYQRYLELYNVL